MRPKIDGGSLNHLPQSIDDRTWPAPRYDNMAAPNAKRNVRILLVLDKKVLKSLTLTAP